MSAFAFPSLLGSRRPATLLQCLGFASLVTLTACDDDDIPEEDEATSGQPSSKDKKSKDSPGKDSEASKKSSGKGKSPDPSKGSDDSEDEDESSDSPAPSPEDSESKDSSKSDEKDKKDKKDWDKLVAKVFPDDRVVQVDIDFKGDGLQDMIDEWKRSRTKSYRETTVSWEGETLKGSGARLKGYSSLMFMPGAGGPGGPGGPGGGGPGGPGGGGPGGGIRPDSKMPLKVNFDRFGGKRLHHMDKASLGTNAFDNSFMRERLSMRMFKRMGIPAPKTAYAKVSLDGKNVGLYTMTQPIDKRFLKQHFGTKNNADDGNLYKCVALERRPGGGGGGGMPMVCSLEWHGKDKSQYARKTGCAHGYKECGLILKTNEDNKEKNDYKDLIHFLDVLNNSSDAEFEDAIDEVFDVDSFLRLLATMVGMSNLDSYIGRINNYYLYHRPDTGKFMMLPWDLNMSYGHYNSLRGRGDTTQAPVKDPTSDQRNGPDKYPLVRRILAVPAYKKAYLEHLKTFMDEHFTTSVHEDYIDEFNDLIRDTLSSDPNRPCSMQDYEKAISDQPSSGSKGSFFPSYNLLDFVNRRRSFVKSQM